MTDDTVLIVVAHPDDDVLGEPSERAPLSPHASFGEPVAELVSTTPESTAMSKDLRVLLGHRVAWRVHHARVRQHPRYVAATPFQHLAPSGPAMSARTLSANLRQNEHRSETGASATEEG